MRKGIACGVALAVLLLVWMGWTGWNPYDALFFLLRGHSALTMGEDFAAEELEEFYYTYSTSAYPPEYLRYRFSAEEDRYLFYHEKREGNSWPLTEQDITVSGTVELTAAQWADFLRFLEGGKVTKRKESVQSGGGIWMYLYWKEDRDLYQEFSFVSPEQQRAFEEFCASLKED